MVDYANYMDMLLRDPRQLGRGRAAIQRILADSAG